MLLSLMKTKNEIKSKCKDGDDGMLTVTKHKYKIEMKINLGLKINMS